MALCISHLCSSKIFPLLLQGSRGSEREAVLLALCARSFRSGRTIVFFRTKQRAHRAKILFGLAGLPSAAELHGDMSQAARLESLDRFRKVGLVSKRGCHMGSSPSYCPRPL